MKKMIIAGGTGFLGNVLIKHFKDKYDEIIILTRLRKKRINNIHFITWDAKTLSGWESCLENADVLINLTGKSVDCRYTEANKKLIHSSRIESTKILNEAVKKCIYPPKVWLNSSTATIYRYSTDKQMDEYTGEIGDDFSMNIAKAWEKEFFSCKISLTRKVALRTSIVLGKGGGAFIPLKSLTKIGFGGKQGNGNQFVSWIHENDFAHAVEFIINNKIENVINVVSPNPIRNKEFMKIIRKALKIPIGIPINKTMLEIGSRIIKTETELVLKSRNVIPKKLIELGFTFKYARLEKAISEIISC